MLASLVPVVSCLVRYVNQKKEIYYKSLLKPVAMATHETRLRQGQIITGKCCPIEPGHPYEIGVITQAAVGSHWGNPGVPLRI